MALVWPIKIDATAKAVLVSLADNANDAGECWPSIDTICERTCFARSPVIRAIQRLEAAGLLVADRSNGRHTRYLITPNQCRTDTRVAETPVAQRHRTRVAETPDPCPKDTLTVKEPSRNHQEEVARGARIPADFPTADEIAWCRQKRPDLSPSDVAERFRDHWSAVPGARGRKVDWPATWRNWVRNTRQGAPPAFATTAAERAAANVASLTGRNRAKTPLTIDVDPTPIARLG